MVQPSEHLQYFAYILRLWQEQSAALDQSSVWRLSVEDVRTHERRGFASLEDLLAFLQLQMEVDDSAASSRNQSVCTRINTDSTDK